MKMWNNLFWCDVMGYELLNQFYMCVQLFSHRGCGDVCAYASDYFVCISSATTVLDLSVYIWVTAFPS